MSPAAMSTNPLSFQRETGMAGVVNATRKGIALSASIDHRSGYSRNSVVENPVISSLVKLPSTTHSVRGAFFTVNIVVQRSRCVWPLSFGRFWK